MVDGRTVSFPELLTAAFAGVRGEVIGVGSRRGEATRATRSAVRRPSTSSTATAVEVEVDRETGELLVVKHVSVADVGKALNPAHVEAQDEGAAIMGLGHTLDGAPDLRRARPHLNLGALDYRIPTTKDVPLELHSYSSRTRTAPARTARRGPARADCSPCPRPSPRP